MTAPVLSIEPALAASIAARVIECRERVAAKYAEADALADASESMRREALRLEHEADALADRLRSIERGSGVSDTRLAPAGFPAQHGAAAKAGTQPSHK